MKKYLLTLSSISALSLGSNVGSFVLTNNKNINLLNETNMKDNQSLVSNSYGALSNSSTLITNQSTSDSKFYTYDLSHFKNKLSNGVDPKTLFFVDTSGLLQYVSGSEKQIPDKEKASVANTKTEIENDKKVTNIKDSYNPYSKSIYNNQFFEGNNWQYLQFGGYEKHIDISSQTNADKIENNQNLNENLGLYYIAKAVIQQKIDEKVADNLAQYFVQQSSLSSSLSSNSALINKIISLLTHNDNIYNFIYNMPFNNNDKNYSLNFIFDNDNNLIEIAYNKWNNEDIIKNVNLSDSISISSDNRFGYYGWYSNITTLTNWKQYFKTWEDFVLVYPKFSFDDNSFLEVKNSDSAKLTSLNNNTSIIKDKKPNLEDIESAYDAWNSNDYYKFGIRKDYEGSGWDWGTYSYLALGAYLWHDDQNVYLQTCCIFTCYHTSNESSFDYQLGDLTFINTMK